MLLKKITSRLGLIALFIFAFALGAGSSYGYFFFKIRDIKRNFAPIPEFASLIGEVVSVSPESVTVKAINIPENPFEKLPIERKVIVGRETPIVRLSAKSAGDYEKEVAEYSRQQTFIQCSAFGKFTTDIKISDKPLSAPFPYIEENLGVSALKPGDRILIDAGEGIKSKEEFPAVRIVVQPE